MSRAALVVGGGTGIGRAVAEALAARGDRVAVSGRRVGPLVEVADAWPDRVVPLRCDVTDPHDRDRLCARAREQLGGLDTVVYSAGMVVHQAPGRIREAALRGQLEVNLVAPLRLGEEALEVLGPGGAVVFVSSTLALRPVVTSAAYSAAKAGMIAAARVLALAGAPRGVRVNVVAPGVVDTDMVRADRDPSGPGTPEERVAAQLDALGALHPLGRLGAPAEVAHAVLHLIDAPWTTGATLVVDGGLMLRE